MSRLVIKERPRHRSRAESGPRCRSCDRRRRRARDRATRFDAAGSEEFDASGLVVAPGFIDMHVHLREPGFEHAETIETRFPRAAAGGFTSICCMPNTQPINDSATVTSYILDQARRFAVVNVFPIGAITQGSAGEELAAIASMKQAGIVAISDDGKPVMNARVVRRAMEFARALDIPLIEHCEDLNLSAGGDMHEGSAIHPSRLTRHSAQLGRCDGRARSSSSPNLRACAITWPTSLRSTRSRWWLRRSSAGWRSPPKRRRTISCLPTPTCGLTTATTK